MSIKLFQDLWDELKSIDQRIHHCDETIQVIHKAHPISLRVGDVPGVGPLTATAIIAAVSDPTLFKNGRELSAWLGLVPQQHSTGGKDTLLGISKRGDSYIRKLLIHGERASIRCIETKKDSRSNWVKNLIIRRGVNRAAVALANKNARTIWVILAKGEHFEIKAA